MADVKIVARPWQPQDLIDELQEMIDEESDNYINTRRTTLCMAKSFLEEHFAEPKWIPVTERLPELHTDDYEEPDGSRMQVEVSDDQWVITISGYQTKARYETCVVFQGWVGEYGETVRNVTHWMPLPELPKGE